MTCHYHLCNNELSGRRTKFCSLNCKNKFYVTENRRNVKKRLVQHFGGACIWCGYSKSVAALQFHHTNDDKEYGVASGGNSRSWAKQLAEASKCVMICANCHAEEHERINKLSLEGPAG